MNELPDGCCQVNASATTKSAKSNISDAVRFLKDTAPQGHAGHTTAKMTNRLTKRHKNTGRDMLELYLFAGTTSKVNEFVVALDRTVKRPIPNQASSAPGRNEWCLTVGISATATEPLDEIYARVKAFIKYAIDVKHRKIFLVWEAPGTINDGVPVDELTKMLIADRDAVPPKVIMGPVMEEKPYAHYTDNLPPGAMLRRVRIIRIK